MPSREEAEALIAAIETDSVIGLRDRALIGVLLYIDADVDLILSAKSGGLGQRREARHARLGAG
jgi:hypothetical protein